MKPRQSVAKIFYDGATYQFNHSRNVIEMRKKGSVVDIPVEGGARGPPRSAAGFDRTNLSQAGAVPPFADRSQDAAQAPPAGEPTSGATHSAGQLEPTGAVAENLSPRSVIERLDALSQEFTSLRREVSVEKENEARATTSNGADESTDDRALVGATGTSALDQGQRKRRCSSSPKLLVPPGRGLGGRRGAKRPRGGARGGPRGGLRGGPRGGIGRFLRGGQPKEKPESDGFESATSDQGSEPCGNE